MLTEREKFWNVGGAVIAVIGMLLSFVALAVEGWPSLIFSGGGVAASFVGLTIVLVIRCRQRRRIRANR